MSAGVNGGHLFGDPLRVQVDGREVGAAVAGGIPRDEVDRLDGPAARNHEIQLRAEFLARAHHAEMGPAMRKATGEQAVVGEWDAMPVQRQQQMILVMRELLDKGVIK